MVSNYHVFLAQLWTFKEVKAGKGRLENKEEGTEWEHGKKYSFSIPKADNEQDYIEVDSKKKGSVTVLGVQNSANDAKELKVILEEKNPDSEKQEWLRGPIDDSGWFTLQNVRSLKYLTAENATTTIITG